MNAWVGEEQPMQETIVMNSHRHPGWAVLFLALAATSPLPAPATVIFSTFGPGTGYLSTNYMPVNFYTQPEIIGTDLAFAFVVPGAQDWQLNAIEIAASWDGTKKNARFTLHGDDAGVPAEAPAVTLGVNPPALVHYPDIAVLTLSPSTSFTLTHGSTYWLSIAPESLDAIVPADDFVMLWLNPDREVTQTSRNWFGAGPWEPWYAPAFEASAPAFRVLVSPVPTPASLSLVLGALALCGAARRRAGASRALAGSDAASRPATPATGP